jgi:deazaflavin-dependent oxidoreductase (nitroreductase family)
MASPTNRAFIKGMSATHKFWYRITGGGIGGHFSGAPILLLTTTGAKSGKQRTAPLMYLEDGDDIVVVASNGGSDRHPGWWANLRRNPQARVQIRGSRRAVRAGEASADERARLWPKLLEMYDEYECYQERTARVIPVVILRPEHATA